MDSIDIKEFLFHGIVDWLNYDNEDDYDTTLCYRKLESILKLRFIVRPCDFEKYNITHQDTSNPYTYCSTFVAYHPNSPFASKFKNNNVSDNGYDIATEISQFGFLLDPILLSELPLYDRPMTRNEIIVDENISLDKYAAALYINPNNIKSDTIQIIRELLKKYGYTLDIVDITTGHIVDRIQEEKRPQID